MRVVLNIIWLLLSGLWLALSYAILGLLLCLTIILIPFGVQLFKIAQYALWPFGRTIVRSANHSGMSTLGNVLWLIPGLLLAFVHLCAALLLAITIIGIPLAVANVKMIPVALTPFGREIVAGTDVTAALAAHRATQAAEAEERRAALEERAGPASGP